jgi:hypothetical protein
MQPEEITFLVEKQARESLQKKNGNAREANRLDSARKIPAQVKSVSVAARKGAHTNQV